MKKWFIGTALTLLALTACAEEEQTVPVTKAELTPENIIVGTGTQFPNICFIDEDGNLTGYDIELVKAIDEKLEDYTFEFQTMDFPNLLLSLETDKIDMIAHQMEVNAERQEKFLFNEEPYNIFPLKVTVHEGNTDIHSIDDLAGKKIATTATSNAAVFIENYIKEHSLDAEIVYVNSTNDLIAQLKSGRVDATINTPFAAALYNDLNDAQQKVVGDPLLQSKVFFLLQKSDDQLKARIDEALVELKQEGIISKLSEKWLGADYTVDF